MRTLWSSPCCRMGLSSHDDPFPCLHADWGNRPCPMNVADAEHMKRREARMYRLGYGYGKWIVRTDVLGLSPMCSLAYFRDPPTAAELEAEYGDRILRVADAVPMPPANDPDDPLDHEVLGSAAD